jgi:FAD:protein FMN transferase
MYKPGHKASRNSANPGMSRSMQRLLRWMRDLGILLLIVVLGLLIRLTMQAFDKNEQHCLEFSDTLMGTFVELKIRTECRPDLLSDSLRFEFGKVAAEVFTEMRRVERVFSTHRLSANNIGPRIDAEFGPRNAAEESELQALILRAEEIRKRSLGSLDIRLARLIKLWNFGQHAQLPDSFSISQLLPDPDVSGSAEILNYSELNFGAIAKGYSVDRAIDVLENQGIKNALVNAGGEIRCLGDNWLLGIQHPGMDNLLIGQINPGERSLATSGDYQNYFEEGGIRYHHLLDPQNGYPARGCKSVSVLAADCLSADAWSTALFIMGPQRGLALAFGLPEIDVLIIDEQGQKLMTSGFAALLGD